MYKNLTNEQISYIYGLFLTDGYLHKAIQSTKTYYSLELELQARDKDIVEQLYTLLHEGHLAFRTRDTNFKKNVSNVIFRYSRQDLPIWLLQHGFPETNKTFAACPPNWDYDEGAFWRGIIDGDGSLGIRKCQTKIGTEPYISLTTQSEFLKLAYHEYILKITGFNEQNKRNKRDNIYNIVLTKAHCWNLCETLYKNDTIHLKRKYEKYLEIMNWRKQYA